MWCNERERTRSALGAMVALLIAGLFGLAGCLPATPPAETTPSRDPAPALAADPLGLTGYESPAERFGKYCEKGRDLSSCLELIKGYETRLFLNNEILPESPAMALRYKRVACELGAVRFCYPAALASANGANTEKNLDEAVRLFRLACNVYVQDNPQRAASCTGLGQTLLALDQAQYYDEALVALGRGCELQRDQCSAREAVVGTGRAPAKAPPDGALGFHFRNGATLMSEICSELGGRASVNGTRGLRCEGARLTALRNQPVTLTLDFCDRDSLCSITATLPATPFAALDAYASLTGGLVEAYGIPTTNVIHAKRECTGEEGKFLGCLRNGNARAESVWEWEQLGRVRLAIVERAGGAATVLSYQNERGMHTFGKPGL